MSLTDAKIRNAKPAPKPYKLTDGNGLYVEIRPTRTKLWRFRYRIAGKENVFALGEYCQAPAGESDKKMATRKASGRFNWLKPVRSAIDAVGWSSKVFTPHITGKRHDWRSLPRTPTHSRPWRVNG